jgi:methyl-accepting chemotaxis protein
MRPAATPALSTDVLERALAASAVVAIAATAGGAWLARSGYGWPSLAYVSCGALVAYGVVGVWAHDVMVRRHRGELARVYGAALQGQRERAIERSCGRPSRLESLTLSLAAFVESKRLFMLRGNRLAGWAAAMRTNLERRLAEAQRLGAGMADDAHIIAEAAAGSRHAEAALAAHLSAVQHRAGAAVTATAAVAQEAAGLADAVRAITSTSTQATAIAARLSQAAFASQSGVAAMSDNAALMAQAADQVQHVLRRADLLAMNAGMDAARAGDDSRGLATVAAEIKSVASDGGAALDSLLANVRELKSQSNQVFQRIQEISDVIQAHHEFGHALAHATMLQGDAVGRLLRHLGAAQGEVRNLNTEAHNFDLPESRLCAGPAQQAVERLPGYAEAMSQILRGLPDFAATDTNWEKT